MYDLRGKKLFVAGHNGMVGRALLRRLAAEDCELLTIERARLDLRDQAAVRAWMVDARPDAVIVAAAKVGGIMAHLNQPVDFLYDNLMIAANIVEAAHRSDVGRLLLLGSSAVYPPAAPQPIAEDALLTGPLEPTHLGYALAKIAAVKLALAHRRQYGHDFISALPTNLYGPHDDFASDTNHVMPALIRKAHEAKQVDATELTIWGSGTPRREFLHVDDCADACVHLMKTYSDDAAINVGSGEDISISALTELVCEIVGFSGAIVRDETKPDGTARKLMSADRIRATGWAPRIALQEGIASTYDWFRENAANPGERSS